MYGGNVLKRIIGLLMVALLSLQFGWVNVASAQSTISIYDRIDLALDWLDTRWVHQASTIGYYIGPGDEYVSLEQNSLVLDTLAIYSRVYTSTKYKENIIHLIEFMLGSQTTQGTFNTLWNPETEKWNDSENMPYQNAYIMESLAFSSFQLHSLEETDEAFYKAVKAVELCLDKNADHMGEDGGWMLRYEDGLEHIRLSENSLILLALLHAAIYEEFWGDPSKAEELAYKAQKTMGWILDQQENNGLSWGYGGFYSGDGEEQLFEANSLAVYAVTAYLRIITSLTDNTNPSLEDAKWSLRSWHDHYLVEVIDEYGGPYYGKTQIGVQEYPMKVGSAGWAARSLVEAWVVLGDRKFKTSADDMYKWMSGLNEEDMDMQINGGFIGGYSSESQVDWKQNLTTTSKALSGITYCNWINIPEFSYRNVALILTLALTLLIVMRKKPVKKNHLKKAS
jgi:hypothetical protein